LAKGDVSLSKLGRDGSDRIGRGLEALGNMDEVELEIMGEGEKMVAARDAGFFL
jgi:hypothetical protein